MMPLILTYTRRARSRGAYLIDQDKKKIGLVTVTGGVPLFAPIGKLFLEADLRAIADALARLGKARA